MYILPSVEDGIFLPFKGGKKHIKHYILWYEIFVLHRYSGYPTFRVLILFKKESTEGMSAILATFAIAPWAYVGFDAIPQAAEEFNFSFKKVSFIMMVAIIFGCFVYTSNNTVAAAALANWPDRVMAGEWIVLVAAEELLGGFYLLPRLIDL